MGRPERLGDRPSAVLNCARRAILIGAVLAAATPTACERGRDEPTTEPPKVSDDSTLADLKAQRARVARRQRADNTAGTPKRITAAPKGSQRLEFSDGTVVVTPSAPKVTATRPEAGCKMIERPGERPVGIPPAPGISARRIAPRRFAIRYEFPQVDRSCRPAWVSVIVDVNDDALPGARKVASVSNRRGRIVFSVPAHAADADVARATAVARTGVPSRSTSVLIR